eukprot:scaffold2688_cov157-Amphora_coffeaeformis.AAC.3
MTEVEVMIVRLRTYVGLVMLEFLKLVTASYGVPKLPSIAEFVHVSTDTDSTAELSRGCPFLIFPFDFKVGCYFSEEEAALIFAKAVHKYRTLQSPLPRFLGEKETPRSMFANCFKGKSNTAVENIGTVTSKKNTINHARVILDLSGIPDDLPLIFKDGSTTKLGMQASKAARTLANAFRVEHCTLPIGHRFGAEGALCDTTSEYLSVWYLKSPSRWLTEISLHGKKHCIGYYEKEEDAALAYSKAVYKYRILEVPLQRTPSGRAVITPTPGTTSQEMQTSSSTKRRRDLLGEYDEPSQAEMEKRRRRRFQVLSHLKEQDEQCGLL